MIRSERRERDDSNASTGLKLGVAPLQDSLILMCPINMGIVIIGGTLKITTSFKR